MIDIKTPELSNNSSFQLLKSWFVEEGDKVEEGDVLAEIQAGMETIEILAPSNGTLANIIISEKEYINSSTTIGQLENETIILGVSTDINESLNNQVIQNNKSVEDEEDSLNLKAAKKVLENDYSTKQDGLDQSGVNQELNERELETEEKVEEIEKEQLLSQENKFDVMSFKSNHEKEDQETCYKEPSETYESEKYVEDSNAIYQQRPNSNIRSLSDDKDLDDFISENSSYAVMLGLSGIGKSSGLQMILQTWYGGNVPRHILDLGQTDTGKFNPIPVHTKDRQQVMLVDIAGEDFRSWLVDNDCQRAVEPMSHFDAIQNEERVGSSYEAIRDNFERLLRKSSYIYIMVPSNDLGIDGVYSPHLNIDECARAISDVMHTYNKNKRVTFLVNHTDELLTLKTQNGGKPYYYAVQENGKTELCCPVPPEKGLIKDINLKKIYEGITNNYKYLIENYLNLIYQIDNEEQLFNDNSLKEYEFVENDNLNFKLNSIMTRSVNRGSPFEFKCLVILYPIHLFIKRKVEEFKEALLKSNQLSPNDRKTIATINRSFNNLFANEQYQKANEHLTTIILEAFAIDELQLPELLNKQHHLEKEIEELVTLEEAIKKRITSVTDGDLDAILNVDIDQNSISVLTAHEVKERLKQLDSKFKI